MQSGRSLQRWLTVVFPVSLALALTPAASAAAPTITGLSPASATAGGSGFTLTINGKNFTSTSISKWGATGLTTTYKSATQLTAAVPASLIATAGTASVTVSTAGGSSSGASFTTNPAPPTITGLNPTLAIAGKAFTLTINGKNFTSTSISKWGATGLTTTYKSATQLTAAVPASLIATAGTAHITVSTAGGSSSEATLTVNPPSPTITSLSPASAVTGGAAFTLTINGTNFTSTSTSKWGATALATTYVSATQLTATVPARLIVTAGTASVTVSTAGGSSSGVPFTINQAPPIISAGISPNRATAGGGVFTLNVFGANFTSTATVNWGTTPLVTTVVGGATLTAVVPASLIATAGSVSVTVTTVGGTSAPVTFLIAPQSPAITSLSPAFALAGAASFTLTVNGTNFTSSSGVYWQSKYLSTTYKSATQLTAVVSASLIATAGSASIAVFSSPYGGWSASAVIAINPALPTITSLTPASVTAGGAGFMLTIKGTAFTSAATSMWGTASLGTTYVSPTQLTAAVPASLIVNSGTASITVTTTAGTSAPAPFTIYPAPPAISGLNPGLTTAGGGAFTLTISGEYFTPASTAKWGSTALTTTYVSATQLTAAVPASLIATAGTASVTVSTSAGTSTPDPFTISPALKITTTTLPSGTAGNAYSRPINVTGGVPGYTWTVTGLPDSLSFFNTSDRTLTITGTPASSGAVTFQVSVQDTTGATAGPVTYTINIAAGPNGANNGSLNGSYACLLQGFIDTDGSRWATVASFQADGQGNFTSGIIDTNSRDIGSASGTMSGSYNIGSDNNGLASIRTILTNGAAGVQTTQWAIALTNAAQPAQQFGMVEADDLGALPSGQHGTANCYLATTSAFAASTISGNSFAFGLDGEDNSGNLKASAGVFNATGGTIASGNIDSAQGGSTSVQSIALAGSYTAPDPATGRFTITLNAGGAPSGLTVYIIDASRMFMLDNTSNDGEQAGNMRTQQQATTSGANMSGPFVLYMRGAEFNSGVGTPSGYYSDVIEGTGDGAGSMTINQSYTNDNGVYSAGNSNGGPTALTFDSTHPGRATFPSASGTTYLNFFNTGSAFEMSVNSNGSVDSGWLEPQTAPQTQTAYTDAALAGNYLFGELPLLNVGSNGNVGEYDLTGSGAITGDLSAAGENNFSWDQSMSMTYGWDATAPGTGTFLIANGAQGGASCAVINATKFVCASQTDPAPSVQVIEQ
jgi:hypothetical protein